MSVYNIIIVWLQFVSHSTINYATSTSNWETGKCNREIGVKKTCQYVSPDPNGLIGLKCFKPICSPLSKTCMQNQGHETICKININCIKHSRSD